LSGFIDCIQSLTPVFTNVEFLLVRDVDKYTVLRLIILIVFRETRSMHG